MQPETIAALITRHKRLWALDFSPNDERRWYDEFKHMEFPGALVIPTYERFCDERRVGARIPRLADVRQYFRKHAPRQNAASATGKAKCPLCSDEGYVAIAAPHAEDREGLDPAMPGFDPPALWTQTRVYAVAVPCTCEVGKAVEEQHPISRAWKDLRRRWLNIVIRNNERWKALEPDDPAPASLPADPVTAYISRCWRLDE